ncbi:serine hydrolase domain-containing protein [Solirubrobacter soli]|uniref:serine hydrolase domain-containing protein n=1 Tax=Solirubrobacter soli TaxID=363832 RepID=UPI0004289379|nr:serine hydrolase domain-containing protein [Solirubrobacter soli]
MDEIWRIPEERLHGGEIPGYVGAVRINGETHVRAAGAMAFGGPPMRPDSRFRIASVTKPIGGALTLLAIEDGTITLDDEVEHYVPELPGDATVRHLLTFTSGWGVTMTQTPASQKMLELDIHPGPLTPQMTGDEFVRRLAQVPRPFAPGEGWLYDTSMDVLAVLLARATGQRVSALLEERIFAPLGMTDTAYFATDRMTTAYMNGEVLDPPDGTHATPPLFEELASGLVSTAEDVLRFYTAVAELVDTEAMTRDQLTPRQREAAEPFLGATTSWGYATGVDDSGRWGWDGGTGTTARVDPANDTVAVLLTQRAMTSPKDGFDDFHDAVRAAA